MKSNTHKTRVSASRSGVGGTPFNQSTRGGKRVGAGAPRRNLNAAKSLPWLESYDLTSPEGVRGFLKEVIRATWTGGLGSRSAGAVNGSIRLLLEHELLPELERRIKLLENRGCA